MLQTQQGVQVDVVPIGQIISMQQAIEVGVQILPHGSVFRLQCFQLL